MTEPTIVLTRDRSSGRIHRRALVGGQLQSAEADNLDQAGSYDVISEEELSGAEPDELCERCFGPAQAPTD